MEQAWYVEYATEGWDHCYIVIHCPTKDGVKPILKKHLQSNNFRIKRITEWGLDHESEMIV